MKYTFTKSTVKLLFLGLAMIGIFSSCKKDPVKPTPNDFTFEVRENLGSALSDAISNNEEHFEILDKDEYADNVYYYMNSMMKQAANLYRFNNTNSGWSQERAWESFVIHNDDEQFAFCIPGGNFYISTGFLKEIEKDYELYFVMAFELTMMQEEVILDKLYSLGIEDIAAISNGTAEPGNLSADDVALNFLDATFIYDSAIVREIDELTMDYICKSSDYNRFGILDLMDNPNGGTGLWFQTRQSYADRNFMNLSEIEIEDVTDCGNRKKTGLYEELVLQHLPE